MLRCFCKGLMILLAIGMSTAVPAGEITRVGDIEIDKPWARASVGTSRPAAAYLTIRNTGDQADRLLAVESPLAGHVMVHASTQQDGIMKMTPLEVLDLPAQGDVKLAPGGTHIMLMDLQQPLVEGKELPLRLILEGAGVIEVSARIGGLAARTPPE